jgi:PAS domain S-box-containing protein
MFHADAKTFKPIHKAAAENDVETAARLLEKRTEIDLRTDTGQTPLHLAVGKEHTRMVHVLLGYHADVNARDHQGMTPLHIAAAQGSVSLITDLLTETGGNVNLPDTAGNTPLHLASAGGQPEVIETLLARGANIKGKNNNGHTPLHEAVSHQSTEAVKLLLARQAAVNDGDTFLRTPLHLAAKAGVKDIVELLIGHSADVNVTDHFGSTPLHEAALRGQLRIAALLLQHGADPERKDQLGRTPGLAAAANGQQDMVTLLQKYMETRAEPAKPASLPPAPSSLSPVPQAAPRPATPAPAPPAPATPAPAPLDQDRETDEITQQARLVEEILNAIPDYVLLVDRRLRFTCVNRHAAQALGHAQTDFTGKTWQELGLPAECMLPFAELCAAVFVTRQAQRGMLTLPSREGAKEVNCQVSPIQRPGGEIASILCTARDIEEHLPAEAPVSHAWERQIAELRATNIRLHNELTEQRRTVDALRAGEERFRLLAEAGSEGIIVSENGIIVEASPQVSLITGYQHYELIGMRVLELIHPEDSELARKHMEALYHRPYRCYTVHKDGDQLWVEVQGKMLSLHDRQVSVAIIRPVEDSPQPHVGGQATRMNLRNSMQPSVPPDDSGIP